MISNLNVTQKELLFATDRKIIIQGAPGCGKTYAVGELLNYYLRDWKYTNQGIACLSFSNTAWKEVQEKYHNTSGRNDLRYPHFIGTIDSFINTFITIPFGNITIGCTGTPVLVGRPVSKWPPNRNKFFRNFDNFSFNENGDLIQIYKADFGIINDKDNYDAMKAKKQELNAKHFINQADSHYYANRFINTIYEKIIFDTLSKRFPILIIDEAQDTSQIQMNIIDKLVRYHIKKIILIGDPDQAIYEWNDAKPKLFTEKVTNPSWTSLVWNKSYRNSNPICKISYNLSTLNARSEAAQTNSISTPPQISSYSNEQEMFEKAMDFITRFSSTKNIILVRGQKLKKILTETIKINEKSLYAWKANHQVIKTLFQIEYWKENSNLPDAYKKLEDFILDVKKPRDHSKNDYLQDILNEVGIIAWRKKLYDLLNLIPYFENHSLREWGLLTKDTLENHDYSIDLGIPRNSNNILAKDIYSEDNESSNIISTIHSVKGKTFDSVCLILGNATKNTNYSTILKKPYCLMSDFEKEELRTIYVALTRAKTNLLILAPQDDLIMWQTFFTQESSLPNKTGMILPQNGQTVLFS